MPDRVLMVSVKPKYAKMIFDGSKRVELRRTRPRIGPGDVLLLYVSSPVKALGGICIVGHVIEKLPEYLWDDVCEMAGLTRTEYDNYFSGAKLGCGIFLQEVSEISNPISLNRLREKWRGFHPPQSFRYLRPEEVAWIG